MDTRESVFARLDRRSGRVHAIVSQAKTGSTTLAATLGRGGLDSLIWTHTLSPGRLDDRAAQGSSEPRQLRYLWEAQWLVAHPPTAERPWSVVTAVRDPIARLVSALFQQISTGEARPAVQSVDALVSMLSARIEQAMAGTNAWGVDWFDMNIESGMGVKVYDHPFEPAVGWRRITNERVDLLLVRMESLDQGSSELASVFGVDVPDQLPAENVGEDKHYAELYRAVLDEFRPPPAYVDEVYDGRLARHFYSPAELDAFRQRWTRPRG